MNIDAVSSGTVALFEQHEIDYLISCPKEISEAPTKELKLVGADWRNNARMVASDGTKGTFAMFMRKNEDFPENFSIGLVYHSSDGRGEITLLRCNGKHGFFNAGANIDHPHWDFHVHRASAEAIEAGFAPEKHASKTTEFASYEEAVQYFAKTVKLRSQDAMKYFPSKIQNTLF